MIDKNDYLHKGLPFEFKVLLEGSGHPADFREGDLLVVFNAMPYKFYEYVLLMYQGRHKVSTYNNFIHGSYAPTDVIGTVKSYERSCHREIELCLGTGEEVYTPDACDGCDRLERVDVEGREAACCMTSSGFVELSLEDISTPILGSEGSFSVKTVSTNTPDDCIRIRRRKNHG